MDMLAGAREEALMPQGFSEDRHVPRRADRAAPGGDGGRGGGTLPQARWIIEENPWKLQELCQTCLHERFLLQPVEVLFPRVAMRVAEDLPLLEGDRPSEPWLRERIGRSIEALRHRMQEDVRNGIVPVTEDEQDQYSTLIEYGIDPVSAFRGITAFDGLAERVRRTWFAVCLYSHSLADLDEEIHGGREKVVENVQLAFRALFGLLPIDDLGRRVAEGEES